MNQDNATNPQPTPAPPPRPPFTGLRSRFIKRTVLAALATLGLVAMTVAVYGHPAWGLIYLATGVWSLLFLALTPLIIKAFAFDRKPLRGILLIVLKIAWLALMFVSCLALSHSRVAGLVIQTALIAGITTPLAVVALRAAGGAQEQRAGEANKKADAGPMGHGPKVESKS